MPQLAEKSKIEQSQRSNTGPVGRKRSNALTSIDDRRPATELIKKQQSISETAGRERSNALTKFDDRRPESLRQEKLMEDGRALIDFNGTERTQYEDEIYDFIDDDPVKTEEGHPINPELHSAEKRVLTKYGDGAIKGINAVQGPASNIYSAANITNRSIEATEEGKGILDNAFKTIKNTSDNPSVTTIMGWGFGLVSPVKDGIAAFLGARTKWSQWTSFEKAVYENPKTKEKKKDAPKEAEYAIPKVMKGFFRKIKDLMKAVSDLVAQILLLIPVSSVVGAAWKMVNLTASVIETIYTKGKSFMQFFKGEKKFMHANSLLENAIGGDEEALQLILDLKLASIAGFGEQKENADDNKETLGDKFYTGLDKLSSSAHAIMNKIRYKEGGPVRIIDLKGLGSGGPKDSQELRQYLQDEHIKNDPKAKELILSEIRESMTGYGK